eukprot:c14285_g1_i1 orf=198-743(-)
MRAVATWGEVCHGNLKTNVHVACMKFRELHASVDHGWHQCLRNRLLTTGKYKGNLEIHPGFQTRILHRKSQISSTAETRSLGWHVHMHSFKIHIQGKRVFMRGIFIQEKKITSGAIQVMKSKAPDNCHGRVDSLGWIVNGCGLLGGDNLWVLIRLWGGGALSWICLVIVAVELIVDIIVWV